MMLLNLFIATKENKPIYKRPVTLVIVEIQDVNISVCEGNILGEKVFQSKFKNLKKYEKKNPPWADNLMDDMTENSLENP